MKTRNPLVLIVLALLLSVSGCTSAGSGSSGDTTLATTGGTAAGGLTPSAGTTEIPDKSADPATIREGIYLDEWTKKITVHFQQTANFFLYENEGGVALSPGGLQAILDETIAADTPDAFTATATTTAFDNFTIRVWHPKGYMHFDETTAYIVQSDPEVTPTATPSPDGSIQSFDSQAPELIYKAATGVGNYMGENDGQGPTEDYMRGEGFIPEGWQWKLSRNESEPEYFLLRMWHPDAYLYSSPETAATYNSYPQPEWRPAFNVDVKPYIPIVGFLLPDLGTVPTPSPTSGS